MTGQRQDRPGQKSAKAEERRTRLSQALRANLLKRKTQAKERVHASKDDEGRQG